jgi:hypothetical protein
VRRAHHAACDAPYLGRLVGSESKWLLFERKQAWKEFNHE